MNTLFVDPWALVVASLLLKSSIVIGMIAGVSPVLKRGSSAATRHLVCTLTFVSLLALPLLSIFGPTWRIAIPSFAAARVVRIDGATQAAARPDADGPRDAVGDRKSVV